MTTTVNVAQEHYANDYFGRYEKKTRLLKRPNGERFGAYSYWLSYIERHVPVGADALEIGCGCGFFLQRLSEKYKATGLEIASVAIPIARDRCPLARLVQADAQALPLQSNGYECVIAFDVAEHVANSERFLAEIYRVLRPGGLSVMTTPNLRSLGARLKGRRPDLLGKPYQQRSEESYIWRDETHISLKMPQDWIELSRAIGFQVIDWGTDSLWDLPYSRCIPFFLQKLILVPFNIIFQNLIGFCSWRLGEVLIVVAKKVAMLDSP